MHQQSTPQIRFLRLTEVALDEIVAHMNMPRVTDHMPLAEGEWDAEACAAFVAAKEACWRRDGLGHWAISSDGRYVGWGGFQKEGEEWDFGLVLRPDQFGLGYALYRITSDVEKLPFPMAPVGALGTIALAESKEEKEGKRVPSDD